jgi:hypothetical protein
VDFEPFPFFARKCLGFWKTKQKENLMNTQHISFYTFNRVPFT